MKLVKPAVAGLALALAACAHAPQGPPPPGAYSNLRYIAEAGDYIGTNLKILGDGPTRTVDYELCEGWCNGSRKFPAAVRGDTLTFTARQDVVNGRGEPAAPWIYRVVVGWRRTLLGVRLIVTTPDQPSQAPEVLRPVRPVN
jgi:hypothetical protein